MKTKKILDDVVEPAVHSDSSTSLDSSPLEWSEEEFTRRFQRALKILETAEPGEILDKPFQTRDGRWLTAEEVVDYAKTLETSN